MKTKQAMAILWLTAVVSACAGPAGTAVDAERHTVVCDGHEVEVKDAAGKWRPAPCGEGA